MFIYKLNLRMIIKDEPSSWLIVGRKASVNGSYFSKRKNFVRNKNSSVYLLATPSTHIPYLGYSKHECVKTVLCVSDAFERVKTFCWVLALNTSFHKKPLLQSYNSREVHFHIEGNLF